MGAFSFWFLFACLSVVLVAVLVMWFVYGCHTQALAEAMGKRRYFPGDF
jgi:hypothetical protein